jgi:hypothetical protein
MGIHSGKWAAIDGFDTVRQWTIADVEAPARGLASNTKFAPVRRKGVRSWTGSYQGFGGTPAMMPGQIAAFVGYGAPSNDISGNGFRYSGNIMADSIDIVWNWRAAEIINHTVNFSGDLELAMGDGAEVVDNTVPDMPSVALALAPQWKPALTGAFAPLSCASQITLRFIGTNPSYVNSCTVINGIVWTGRRAGPIDWTATIVQDDDARVGGVVPLIGDDIELKLFIDGLQFWLLQFGHVRDYTGITANRETGAILSRTVNIDMTAYPQGGAVIGKVVKPDTTTWWPYVTP